MRKNNPETEITRLRKENKSLTQKLATANSRKSKLQKELKKKDEQKIELSKEQLQSLSNQLKDIDILNLLLDWALCSTPGAVADCVLL
ncbi:hypothetical protein FACS189435_0420 [Bacteroidia bacterium]|nr:hypothetical protein FACS189435_0420 [Bacteroidia bacterium]